MNAFIFDFWKNEAGTTAIEYSIIAAGIALAIVAAVSAIGGAVSTSFNNVQGGMP